MYPSTDSLSTRVAFSFPSGQRDAALTAPSVRHYTIRVPNGEHRAKTYLPTESETPGSRPWLPGPDDGPGGPVDPEATPYEGPLEANGLTPRLPGGLDKAGRLRKKSEFEAVKQRGKWWSNPVLTLRALPNQREYSRYGFLVSGRVGKAVVRNRVKRRLKEITRRETVRQGWDLVFIARARCAQAPFSEIRAAVKDLLRRARLTPDGGGVSKPG